MELVIVFDYFKRYYNPQLQNLMFEIAYKLLYIYSLIEIYLYKLSITTNIAGYIKNIKEYTNLIKNSANIFEFIKDGQLIIHNDQTMLPESFDFIIYTDTKIDDNGNTINNIKLIQNTERTLSTLYELSNVRFILMELHICDKTYKVELRDKSDNFYIVGNRFDSKFFKYYFNKYITERYSTDSLIDEDIILKIIDHEVNTLELNLSKNNDAIILGKDSYILEVNEK